MLNYAAAPCRNYSASFGQCLCTAFHSLNCMGGDGVISRERSLPSLQFIVFKNMNVIEPALETANKYWEEYKRSILGNCQISTVSRLWIRNGETLLYQWDLQTGSQVLQALFTDLPLCLWLKASHFVTQFFVLLICEKSIVLTSFKQLLPGFNWSIV